MKDESILFLADLDGTILGGDHRILEPTHKAILNLQDLGILFSVATGRSSTCIEQCALPVNCPGVFDNGGAICQSDGKIISCFAFSRQELKMLRSLIKRNRHNITYAFSSSSFSSGYTMLFLNEKNPQAILKWFGISIGRVAPDETNFLKEMEQGSHRLSLVGDIKDIPPELNHTTNDSSGVHFHEFTRRGVNKGKGVEILAKYLGIPRRRVIIAGNDVNDLSMFQLNFGVRIAVGPNCPEEIQRRATHYVETMEELPLILRGLAAKLRR
ncbi:MAG: cof-like protein hydrolase [Candidatus Magasanikbacteria bacterium GW2011_GWC2_40_17]|uniref:Cof-like protein hydrolase n=1 Tax=Candidatus Magasanikbacteria bacterium GW2011_GWA2_42_32 TaxID=1619039 RepID=A0A0G1A636_9BACT|nr:MAG: cof-like protein hydrolase [Candidatus Magasanikbacteria bacterium GW2011_GWC2_40_17]KKS56384.1 MAG: cof-like protein hydrolase [Candidatus Magasanikbacteria bacterium GW2011_GWA2_42_32]OGH85103.1 MAG: hypothetical protein A2294_03905 [Candidatus Magasanikbacteria bacterium RIFOXYB2_FULL_38_10]